MIVTHSSVSDSPSDILGHNINSALKCCCEYIELTSSPQHLHQCVDKLSYATFPWCQIVYIYQSLSVGAVYTYALFKVSSCLACIL